MERAFTNWLRAFFPADGRVRIGIGDDAAVVKGHAATVVACDPVVEGVHFGAADPRKLVGRKAVNRNLADLAAMGAVPDHLVVSALLPAGMTPARRRSLFTGIRDAAAEGGCTVVGGDVAVTPGPLTVTVTALGHLPGRALRRDGARVGDRIHVTGVLGGSRLGGHLRFRPPLAEGLWLARQRSVTAALDVSDGLLLDLHTMLVASGGHGAVIDAEAVPLSRAARRAAACSGRSALEHALHDGEDHVLLFTVRRGVALAGGGPLSAVGRAGIGVVMERPGLWLRDERGRVRRVAPGGFQHPV